MSKCIVYSALMSAMLIVGKYVLSFIPNIEVVTTLTICFTYVFGYLAVAATMVFCLIDMVLYPFSIDVAISYFIYWNALTIIVATIKKCGVTSHLPYIILSIIMTLFFGVLTSFMTALIFDLNFLVIYIAGIKFYAFQLLSNLVLMNIGFSPLTKLLSRLNNL